MKLGTVISLQLAAILGVVFGWFAFREHNVLLALVSGYIICEAKGYVVELTRRA
jgi:ABC-type branched-subunit amino acid transport system permease subunit